MKRTIYAIGLLSIITSFNACKEEQKNSKPDIENTEDMNVIVSGNSTPWATLVESRTNVVKPEFYQEEYWEKVNKDVDYDKILKTIIDGVIKGKVKAYDIAYDTELTVDQVKEKVGMNEKGNFTLSAKDLAAIKTRESWRFDEENFVLEKKVTRIDFLLYKLVETDQGEIMIDKGLFYIKMNE